MSQINTTKKDLINLKIFFILKFTILKIYTKKIINQNKFAIAGCFSKNLFNQAGKARN
tara:strand:- start:81 stop:254 length:174 start_codon:yes stop_codon:yes gene_type:complete